LAAAPAPKDAELRTPAARKTLRQDQHATRENAVDEVNTARELIKESKLMSDKPTAARTAFGDIAPALADYTDNVLFGDVWERPGLAPRDRSLITVATLVALYRTNELPFHLKKAIENGISREELTEVITHLAFYLGWPTAASAVTIAKHVFEEIEEPE
jgi:4-carboxymuconolactone decarboxylase